MCLRTISQWAPNPQFCIVSLKIKLFKLQPHLPGANELKEKYYQEVML